MKFKSFPKQTIIDSTMAMKLASLVILLMLCYSSLSMRFNVQKVPIPKGCCGACPPQSDPARFICAKHSVTGRLGMFDSECFFGRYNHCVFVKQPYKFIRYGHCQSGDF